MSRPLALDLFCKAGGASMGLYRAGFDVVGVDIEPQPRYPFAFVQADALKPPFDLSRFDFIWASPPCQFYSALRPIAEASAGSPRNYQDLVAPTREMLLAAGVPYCIENVPGSPLRWSLLLCGEMFGLRTYRHRHFETSWLVMEPHHPPHRTPSQSKGRNRKAQWLAGAHASVYGDIGTYAGPEAMGIDWMNGRELGNAVPPAYSEYIGRAALHQIDRKAA